MDSMPYSLGPLEALIIPMPLSALHLGSPDEVIAFTFFPQSPLTPSATPRTRALSELVSQLHATQAGVAFLYAHVHHVVLVGRALDLDVIELCVRHTRRRVRRSRKRTTASTLSIVR